MRFVDVVFDSSNIFVSSVRGLEPGVGSGRYSGNIDIIHFTSFLNRPLLVNINQQSSKLFLPISAMLCSTVY